MYRVHRGDDELTFVAAVVRYDSRIAPDVARAHNGSHAGQDEPDFRFEKRLSRREATCFRFRCIRFARRLTVSAISSSAMVRWYLPLHARDRKIIVLVVHASSCKFFSSLFFKVPTFLLFWVAVSSSRDIPLFGCFSVDRLRCFRLEWCPPPLSSSIWQRNVGRCD